MDLKKQLSEIRIPRGELAICWLGQAGFLVKDDQGTVFVIDPYLSDCGMRIRGFKRLSAQIADITDLNPDYYCITHTHFDHYDFDTVPQALAETNCLFAGPSSCQTELEKLGAPPERCRLLNAGDRDVFRGMRIEAVKADHGTMAPDAIGILLRAGNHIIYFSGDSSYHPDWNVSFRARKPDIGCLSINGKFGNMNAREGAIAAGELGLKTAIPCHFWTFAEHGGDPEVFVNYLHDNVPSCQPLLMRQGEIWITGGVNQ